MDESSNKIIESDIEIIVNDIKNFSDKMENMESFYFYMVNIY